MRPVITVNASRIAIAGQSWVRTKVRIVDSYAR
jgi:hypothetical protein